jgi:hypothetical protein
MVELCRCLCYCRSLAAQRAAGVASAVVKGVRSVTGIFGLSVLAFACGGKGSEAPASAPAAKNDIEYYFPLEDGKIYHYVTKEGGETGMLVAKVHRPQAHRGELRVSNGTKRFMYVADGVTYVGGAYILKAPLETGASWPGEHGGTTKIVATDATITVPAGKFTSCVKTVEEGGRPATSHYESTFCPGIGLVQLVVTAQGNESRAELKGYGMPIKID